MKYLWTYVDARGKWYLKAKSYYSFGTTLHKVLERFHDSGDVGVTTVGDALKVYEESWLEAGYASPEEMQEAFEEDVQSDFAMACYQLLIRKNFPGVPVKATIHALRAKAKATASMTNDELATFESDIRVLGEQILATTIEDHSPSLKALCDECDFLQLCKKDPRYA